MRAKINILLLILAAAGGAFLLWPQKRNQQIDQPLFEQSFIQGLDEVELQRGAEIIKLKKITAPLKLHLESELKPGDFEVIAPKLCAPSQETLSRLGVALQVVASRNTIEGDKKAFGLDAPEYRLILRGSGRDSGHEAELILGKEHPFSGRRYAQLAGESSIFLVDEALLRPVLDAEFCDLKPLKISLTNLVRVEIQKTGEEKLVLKKEGKESSRWSFESGELADTQLTEKTLEQFLSEKMTGAQDPLPGTNGTLGKVTLAWSSGDNQKAVVDSFFLTHKGSGVIAVQIEGAAASYLFKEGFGRLVLLTKDALRNRSILQSILPSQLSSFCLETPKFKVHLKGTPDCSESAGKSLEEEPGKLQEIFQRFQVLSIEKTEGRFISKEPPACELEGIVKSEGKNADKDGEKFRFLALGEVESLVHNSADDSRPRQYYFDLGTAHTRGVVSADMVHLLCDRQL